MCGRAAVCVDDGDFEDCCEMDGDDSDDDDDDDGGGSCGGFHVDQNEKERT